MKLLIFLCFVAMGMAATAPAFVKLLRYEVEPPSPRGYRYFFQQSDDTIQESRAVVKNEGREDQHHEVTGFYSFIAPDTGILYVVKYTAGTDGYQATQEEGPGSLPPNIVATCLG
ncbi:hypothetical protein ABMA27_015391 [Loxostege sticticalis]|uniref:Uncharacterized protein n=1 Tax=Loxostege sticticalis TaxID=481309 RepID=A0ABR3I7H1_LOXSC